MDLDKFIERVKAHDNLQESELMSLCEMVLDIFVQEGNVVSIAPPVTVAGDVHGQFYDVLRLFTVAGDPKETKFLWLGDYVDRGEYSIETVALLFAYKARYPTTFFMLRGNHESPSINRIYGFYEEVVTRFGHAGFFSACNEVFNYLPIAAVIGRSIFCVHGGLSPKMKIIEQLAVLERRQDIPSTPNMISDLVWSDPEEIDEWGISQRGAGYLFGRRPAEEFLRNNRLKMIARAHQLAINGFHWWYGGKQVVTVWSAPNYTARTENPGCVMAVNDQLECDFKVFEAVPENERRRPGDRIPDYFSST